MKKLFLPSLIVLSTICSAQKMKIDTNVFLGYDTTAHYVMLRQSNVYNKSTAISQMVNLYSLTNNDSLNQYSTETDKVSSTYKFQQYNTGVPVYGAKMYVHCDGNNVMKLMNGTLINTFLTDASPAISGNNAINYAIKYCGAQTYKWQDTSYQNNLKRLKNDTTATYFPTPQLLYYPIDTAFSQYTLVYNVVLQSLIPYNTQSFIIDAKNGNLVTSIELLCSSIPSNNTPPNNKPIPAQSCFGACNPGNGNTLYYSVQNIYMWEKIQGFTCVNRLEDGACNGTDIKTRNLVAHNNASATAGAAADGEYEHEGNYYGPTDPGGQQAAVTAHWVMEKTNEYYRNIIGRSSFDNANGEVDIWMSSDALGGGNAYWDVTEKNLNFGSGDASYTPSGNPPVGLDIVSHEFTHGVTEETSDLLTTGISGALNEGFSDIMGTVIKDYIINNYSTYTGFNYTIGNDAYLSGSIVNFGTVHSWAQRNLAAPWSSQQPSTFNAGPFWMDPTNTAQSNDYGGKHINGAVIGYWFFLLAEGGTGTNDLRKAYCVSGIGKDEARAIAYKTWTQFLTTNSRFADARTWSIQAATDLYGYNSNEVAQVISAWYAVGVGPAFSGDHIIGGTINGNYNYSRNTTVIVWGMEANPGANVTITSGTEIQFWIPNGPPPYVDTYYKQGSKLAAYISASCAGGARLANNNNIGTNNNAITPTQNVTQSTASIENTSNSKSVNGFAIIPNPSEGVFNLMVDDYHIGSQAFVFNSVGAQVTSFYIQQTNSSIDLSTYDSGMYLVKILRSNGTSYNKRIIKQ